MQNCLSRRSILNSPWDPRHGLILFWYFGISNLPMAMPQCLSTALSAGLRWVDNMSEFGIDLRRNSAQAAIAHNPPHIWRSTVARLLTQNMDIPSLSAPLPASCLVWINQGNMPFQLCQYNAKMTPSFAQILLTQFWKSEWEYSTAQALNHIWIFFETLLK